MYLLLLLHLSELIGGLLDYGRLEPFKLVNLKCHMLCFLRWCLKLCYHTAAVESINRAKQAAVVCSKTV